MAGRKTQLNVKRTSTYDLDLFVFQAIGIIFLFLTGFNQGHTSREAKQESRRAQTRTALTPADDLGSESTNAWYKSQLRLSQLSSLLTSKMARLLVSSLSLLISSAGVAKRYRRESENIDQVALVVLACLLFVASAIPFNAAALPGGWHYNGDVAR